MDITRVVLVYAVLCSAVGHKSFRTNSNKDLDMKRTITSGVPSPRVSHRVQLLFPLLLRISTRLATLIPTAVMGVIGIFLFVAFSKKAFIISLLALFLTYLDKYKRDEDNIIHIHKIKQFATDELLAPNEDHVLYEWPQRKRLSHDNNHHFPHGYWSNLRYTLPLRFPYRSYPQSFPYSSEGFRRTFGQFQQNLNRSVPSDL